MHTLVQFFAILAALARLPELSVANWTPGKAAQINFYDGGTCSTYIADATSWWTGSPFVGGTAAETGAECFLLNMPGYSTGISNAMMWEESIMNDTVEPALANGWCTYWDGFNCTGNEFPITYTPAGAQEGPCEAERSKDGFLWKSAKLPWLTLRPAWRLHQCTHDAGFIPSSDSTIEFIIDFHSPNHFLRVAIYCILVSADCKRCRLGINTEHGHSVSDTFSTASSITLPSSSSLVSSFHNNAIPSSESLPSYSSSISASLVSVSAPPSIRVTKESLPPAMIAGVTTGAVSLVVVSILLVFCIRRRSRKKPEAVLPYLLSEPRSSETQRRVPAPLVSEKFSRSGMSDSQPRSTTPSERRRHQSLVANELRALREEMVRLNSAVASGDGNDARIRALERELQSYADAERLDPSLPGYLD
ncbi:hypothetical protein K438DRAFT_2074705 [Mycena galopus ATCC 62051]|nr:hypothetical protein K438DRAFT_2074705 [Mycena galopus ATCC 62051]